MSWFLSVALFISYAIHRDIGLLIASGLFAIAGSIAFNCGKK